MAWFLTIPSMFLGGLFGWLQPTPTLPPGHEGLCQTERAGDIDVILCTVPLDRYSIVLRAEDETSAPYQTFERARDSLGGAPARLIANAGMYHEDRRAVGLAVQDGRRVHDAVLGTGGGNFSLRPNGVFFIENGRATVRETERYLSEAHEPDLATQSGPMLLIDGQLHPRFIRNSDSRFVRNGVAASPDGRTVYLALTRQPINFHDFAIFFRDRLAVDDALFLDGQVSSLSYPAGSIEVRRDRLGPMLVVVDR